MSSASRKYLIVVDLIRSLLATKLNACHMSSGSSGISPIWLYNEKIEILYIVNNLKFFHKYIKLLSHSFTEKLSKNGRNFFFDLKRAKELSKLMFFMHNF